MITIPTNLVPNSQYYLGVRVDYDGTFSEATEDNNAAYHILWVK